MKSLYSRFRTATREELFYGGAAVAGYSSSFHLFLPNPLSIPKNLKKYAHLLRLERSLNVAREELL
jgi:hypothetical protein